MRGGGIRGRCAWLAAMEVSEANRPRWLEICNPEEALGDTEAPPLRAKRQQSATGGTPSEYLQLFVLLPSAKTLRL